MYDVITFGSATRDIFVKSKNFLTVADKQFTTGFGICLTAGSKLDIDDIYLSSGGGGTNTAAAFAKQGFKTAYCGLIGSDISGDSIVQELKDLKVSIDLIGMSKEKTDHSIVFSMDGKERSILTYRGASGGLSIENINWKKLKSKWFYLAPLSGKSAEVFEKIVDFANNNKIGVAVNPGMSQVSLPEESLKRIFGKIDILFLNQEESAYLTKIPYENEKEIFLKLDKLVKGICVMTKGEEGVVVSDGKHLFRAGAPKIEVIDRTGAGDAFASGFLSNYIWSSGDVGKAVQLGIANANGCLSEWGAKGGLLGKNSSFANVEVLKEPCQTNGLCEMKI